MPWASRWTTAIPSAATSWSTPSVATAVRAAGHGRPVNRPIPGAIYYCRYFELAEGVEHLDAPILNPRGDLGYMGFNTFRGDNRTFAVILLAPAADHELRVLRHEQAWSGSLLCDHAAGRHDLGRLRPADH